MECERKRRWILAPCPAYDVEGTEKWLQELARKGWQMSEDGFFCGFGAFDRTSPKHTVYRLSVDVQKKAPMDETYGPDEELTDYSRKCGWEYIARRGDFYIWRSDSAEPREMDTDPQVKAMAVDGIRKRQRSNAVAVLIWGLVYPLAKIRGGIFLSMVNLGTGFVLAGLLLSVWFFVAACVKAVRLNKLRKAILGEAESPVAKKQIRYYVPVAARWILTLIWIFVCLFRVMNDISGASEIPVKDYTGDPPFATIADFAGPEGKDYRLINYGYSNKVRQWEDWLAPVSYDWDEIAAVTMPDGQTLEGMLFLEYNEVRYPWAAMRIAREYWLNDRWEKGYEKLGDPDVDADYCVAYLDNIHTPTVVICVGNKVIRASFRTYSDSVSLPVDAWAGILADSLR